MDLSYAAASFVRCLSVLWMVSENKRKLIVNISAVRNAFRGLSFK